MCMSKNFHDDTCVLAITLGDPAGVGPEICIKALSAFATKLRSGALRFVLVGARSSLYDAQRLTSVPIEIGEFHPGADWPDSGVAFHEVAAGDGPFTPGKLSAAAGEVAYQATVAAVDLVQSGHADAIVTAPLNKEAMFAAGRRFAGYTDLLAHLTESDEAVMMLAHHDLRVSHVTTHVALQDVPRLITPARLTRVVHLTHDALRDFGVDAPRIAVAALNPHAGENGAFGSQDAEVVEPVVRSLRQEGLIVDGPIPADTLFVKAVAGQFDAVVAMYHDQGHIPVKLLGFKIDKDSGQWRDVSGVNITLGLPIIRTSVDHGTAFDIAGRGIANEGSLIEAIEIAEALGAARRPKSIAATAATTKN